MSASPCWAEPPPSYLASRRSEGLFQETFNETRHRGRLFDVLYAPENTYEHFWSNGDLVVWDNRALQHCRSDVLLDDVGSAPRRYIVRAVRLGRSDLARTADVSGF